MEQTRPFLVGITGGIGSGKSVICKIFQCLGIPVYDADSRAKQIMNEDVELKAALIRDFGQEVYTAKGLHREYLAKLVFGNPEKLAQLNSLTHPAVARDFEKWVMENRNYPYLVKEAALFVESGSYTQMDMLILVSAPEAIKIKRVLNRDSHRNLEDVRQILKRQLSDEEKRKYCQEEIVNDGMTEVLPQVLRIDSLLRN